MKERFFDKAVAKPSGRTQSSLLDKTDEREGFRNLFKTSNTFSAKVSQSKPWGIQSFDICLLWEVKNCWFSHTLHALQGASPHHRVSFVGRWWFLYAFWLRISALFDLETWDESLGTQLGVELQEFWVQTVRHYVIICFYIYIYIFFIFFLIIFFSYVFFYMFFHMFFHMFFFLTCFFICFFICNLCSLCSLCYIPIRYSYIGSCG